MLVSLHGSWPLPLDGFLSPLGGGYAGTAAQGMAMVACET
jgi:hypothetical protein